MPRRALLSALILAVACGLTTVDRKLYSPNESTTLDHRSPYLKAHMRDGRLYVLDQWHFDDSTGVLIGDGTLYDALRVNLGRKHIDMPRDSFALFETNSTKMSGAGKALTVMAGITAAIAVACATNPKACFGSCPTFYAPDSSGRMVLQAEGFSASIAPGLEATDVDALYRARPSGNSITLHLTNEALETHVIRYADLLVAPRPPNGGGRVFVTPGGEYLQATGFVPASTCIAAEGDCTEKVARYDGRERFSPADSTNLAARETIDLTFNDVGDGPLGVVVTSRQTLLTTFLIYQALAYMGTNASRWLAAIGPATPDSTRAEDTMAMLVGRIEVLVPDDHGNWIRAGETGETGPIASDTKVIPLPLSLSATRENNTRKTQRVRLRLTKGLWRLDWVSLVHLGAKVTPVRVAPARVTRDGRPDSVTRANLATRAQPLVTLPGDAYDLQYALPADIENPELWLEARGYYLEWMRQEWIAEESKFDQARLAIDPGGMLRKLAPRFKAQEATMDSMFWQSRYAKP